ncbi:hypothetical protein V6N11_075614 [Hibiscus sabdariffa]|uniref:Uncharacterized protein n=1 Tax=Hibiscus sabdariffa TaxID=183260 RepID=A0ABR2R710_9ROSI
MIGVFDDDAIILQNSRKHRRLDDDPHDRGGSDPAATGGTGSVIGLKHPVSMASSYKDSLMQNSSIVPPESDEIMEEEDIIFEDGEIVRGERDGSCPATCQSSNVDEHSVSPITKQQLAEECSFGPWMMVERKQRKPLSKQNDPSNSSSSPFLQGSRFNLLSDAINGDGNAPAIPSEPLADVPIHQVRSAASIPRAKPRSKGKMHVSSKPVKSVSLRKTLVFNFFDFSVLARNPNRASSSNIPPLDPTKHMAVVVDENLDPNIGVLPATSPMSDHTPPIGKPPDT